MTAADHAIDIIGLRVRYGDVAAVDGLSLQAERGEVLGLLGPNGAGKTTTVETLEGFRRPSEGSVRVLGLDPVADHDRLMTRLGVMLQSCRLYSAIRPIEALRLFASYYPAPAAPGELLDRVGMTARARTAWRKLSGGEQQRLALALALVGRPEVVVLDEPTAGLDLEGRLLVRAVVAELRDAGVCVVLTSHELTEVERVADRVAIVQHGRLLAVGTPAELAARAGRPSVRFTSSPGLDVAALSAAVGAPVADDGEGRYVVDAHGDPALLARLSGWLAERGLALDELRSGGAGLEDVFLRLTAGDDDGGDRP
ncbi:MAG: ABC transporter ATP-binding protein [Acidimicrobiales bacterium]